MAWARRVPRARRTRETQRARRAQQTWPSSTPGLPAPPLPRASLTAPRPHHPIPRKVLQRGQIGGREFRRGCPGPSPGRRRTPSSPWRCGRRRSRRPRRRTGGCGRRRRGPVRGKPPFSRWASASARLCSEARQASAHTLPSAGLSAASRMRVRTQFQDSSVTPSPGVRVCRAASSSTRGGGRPRGGGAHRVHPAPGAEGVEGADGLLLGGEVPVEGARRDARRVGDVLGAGGTQPVPDEESRGGAGDVQAGLRLASFGQRAVTGRVFGERRGRRRRGAAHVRQAMPMWHNLPSGGPPRGSGPG